MSVTERELRLLQCCRQSFKKALETKTLELNDLKITDDELLEWVMPFLNENPDIHDVCLVGNSISDKGAKALAETITIIMTLNLGNNQIGIQGVRDLVRNNTIISLNLYGNPIKKEGRNILYMALKTRQNTRLQTLTYSTSPSDLFLDLLRNAENYAKRTNEAIEQAFTEHTPNSTLTGIMHILHAYAGVLQQPTALEPISAENPNPQKRSRDDCVNNSLIPQMDSHRQRRLRLS